MTEIQQIVTGLNVFTPKQFIKQKNVALRILILHLLRESKRTNIYATTESISQHNWDSYACGPLIG